MKTYLVTGGAGFIGSNFIRYLLEEYTDVKVVNFDALTYAGNLDNLQDIANDPRYTFYHGDICSTIDLEVIWKENFFDYVVNFAAESHVDRSLQNPSIFVKTNVQGTVNVMDYAVKNWCLPSGDWVEGVRFLQVSTDEVYGDLSLDQPNIFFTEDTPLDPHSPYAASKAAADLLVKSYWDTYRMPINITRCSNNYGPYQFPEKMIPLMINNALALRKLPVYGSGMQVRDWLDVTDHCRAIDAVLTRGKLGQIYNIGGHNEYRNIDVIKLIIANLQRENPRIDESLIEFVTDRKCHDQRYGIDPTKISKEVGWKPETKFADGIKRTISWYIKNKNWLEKVTSGAYQSYYQELYGTDAHSELVK